MPTIGWSEFARKNCRAENGNSYTTLDEDQVIDLIDSWWPSWRPGAGETGLDRKVLIKVPPYNFYCPPRVQLTPDLPVRVEVVTRQAGEAPYVELFVARKDALRLGLPVEIPAARVDIVCYSAEALLENGGERSTDCDWEIVTILCSPTPDPEPMKPLTMARNFLEEVGGTKGDYTAEEFAEAIWYWSQQGIKVK